MMGKATVSFIFSRIYNTFYVDLLLDQKLMVEL